MDDGKRGEGGQENKRRRGKGGSGDAHRQHAKRERGRAPRLPHTEYFGGPGHAFLHLAAHACPALPSGAPVPVLGTLDFPSRRAQRRAGGTPYLLAWDAPLGRCACVIGRRRASQPGSTSSGPAISAVEEAREKIHDEKSRVASPDFLVCLLIRASLDLPGLAILNRLAPARSPFSVLGRLHWSTWRW
jgi:hypothetical protein